MEFKIIGKNDKTINEIHKQFIDSRKGLNKLMINRILIIGRVKEGANLKLRDRNLIRFIKEEDITKRIEDGFPKGFEKGIDYEIEVSK